jgi:hypothetical protein
MFENKQKSLIAPTAQKTLRSSSKTGNAFLNAGLKKGAETRTGNGALAYKTTGNELVDQFGKVSTYKIPRSYKKISADADKLWAESKLDCVKFSLFLRTIPRQVSLLNGEKTEKVQKGSELKHEPIMRMFWLHSVSPKTFWDNIGLFISLGSWHDIFTMLQYDLVWHGWNDRKLNWEKFGRLILTGLKNKAAVDLVKKYLPQIKSNKQCNSIESQANNIIAKWVCSLAFGTKGEDTGKTYKAYRKLKTSGTAHEWQQLISKQRFEEIDFSKIHGRALTKLVRSKFLKNQNLSEKYASWIKKPETQNVKCTSFVHELFEPLDGGFSIKHIDSNQEETINKQFMTLVNKGRPEKATSFIVVRDTSSSMTAPAVGTNMTSYGIGKALALFFSEFLTGVFANSFINFAQKAELLQWKGSTPVQKFRNDRTEAYGGTNFQNVFQLFAQLKAQGVPEKDFPTGIIVLSDGGFNPTNSLNETNVDTGKRILRAAGFSDSFLNDFSIVLWNIPNGFYVHKNGNVTFETYQNQKGVYYFSGYSGSIISFLIENKVETAAELVAKALDQEVLNMVQV